MSILDVAAQFTQRGWAVVPIPVRSKNPGFKGWERLRLKEDELPRHFNGESQNIGVLIGEPSGWLIDIDLDHPLAVELADQFLPPTPLEFGRASKPRSHRLYRVTAPTQTKKYRSKSAGMIVELRSTGGQTVFPGSVHESGEAISWVNESAEPARVDPDELHECVKKLADAVKVRLGERTALESLKQPVKQKSETASEPRVVAEDERARRCLDAMLLMDITDHNDGSSRLYAAACRTIEHDLSDPLALASIRAYTDEKPFPRNWSDAEILKRIRDAEKECERGIALNEDEADIVALGTRDPKSGRLVLSPRRTLPTAEAFIREKCSHPQGRTLHSFAEQLLAWRNNRYVATEDGAIKKSLQRWLHDALRYVPHRRTGELQLVDFESNPMSVNSALETIRAFTHLAALTPSPSWLNNSPENPPPNEVLPCRSTLLHLPTMRRLEPTPAFFTLNALEFDYDPHAPPPMLWLRFLHELFDDDIESQELLQDWAGYLLTGDTSLQKMLLLVGPRRSGKGTIARVLTRLIGNTNVCSPTTSSLAGPFGLQPLIGKTLALVSDARFSGDHVPIVVERLLCISGEDALSIDRKFLGSVWMKLATRFMFLSNELPRLHDASNALAGRFVILRTGQSFYGREDRQLTAKLLLELPGILNWAIEGWKRLQERGRLIIPKSVEDAVGDLEDLSSPVGAFVRELCVVGAGHRVAVDALYEAWKAWCQREGRNVVSPKPTFGRDLAAAVAGVVRRRGTDQVAFYEGIALKAGSQ